MAKKPDKEVGDPVVSVKRTVKREVEIREGELRVCLAIEGEDVRLNIHSRHMWHFGCSLEEWETLKSLVTRAMQEGLVCRCEPY